MKHIFFILLFSSSVFSQSPTAFRRLDLTGVKGYGAPVEYNAWAGAALSYPLIGSKGSFDLNFGLTGKFVIDFTQIEFGRTWYVLTYGNLNVPPANTKTHNAVSSQDNGIVFGFQGYTIFGTIYSKALTAIFGASAKLNSFGSTQVYSYRFGSGLEISLGGKDGLPLVANVSPAYVLLNDRTQFSALQNESASKGFWTADASIIFPVGDKLGLLIQSAFTEYVAPTLRAGIILSAGL